MDSESEKGGVQHVASPASKGTAGDTELPEARGVDTEDIPDAYWWSFRFLGSVLSIILMAVSLYVSFSLPASALTVINQSLGPSSLYIWITDASGIITAVGLLIVGRVSDIVGRRWFLIIGQVFGVIGSIICAKSTSISMIIAGSTIYGVACTTQLTFPYVIQELVPNKHRGLAQAAVIVGVLPFAGFGSLIAREFINNPNLGWRWCYWLNLIVNAATLILLTLCYYPPNFNQLHSQLTWKKELSRMDWGGMFIFAAAQVLILLALNWGGGTYPWKSAHVVAPLVIGGLLFIIFFLYEIYVPLPQPLVPLRLLKNGPYIAIVIVASAGQMVFTSLSILWPQQIEFLYTTNNIRIGWMAITSGLCLAAAEIIMGPLLRIIGHTRWQLIASSVLLLAFLAGMAGVTEKTQSMAIVFTCLAGFFSGWVDIISLVANGLVNDSVDLGLANGFMGSVKQTVGIVSVSVFIAVLQSRFSSSFPKDVAKYAMAAGLPSNSVADAIAAAANGTSAAFAGVPGINSTIESAIRFVVKKSYVASFKTVYLTSIAFGAIAVIASSFTSDIDKHMTGYVSRRIVGTVATEEVPKEKTIVHEHIDE